MLYTHLQKYDVPTLRLFAQTLAELMRNPTCAQGVCILWACSVPQAIAAGIGYRHRNKPVEMRPHFQLQPVPLPADVYDWTRTNNCLLHVGVAGFADPQGGVFHPLYQTPKGEPEP